MTGSCAVQCKTGAPIHDGTSGVRRPHGFTLIEMTVIIAVLLIIAAVIMPRIDSALRSQAAHEVEGRIQRLPAQALAYAVEKQTPVRIRIDGTQLIMETAPADGYGQMSSNGTMTTATSNASQQIKAIDLGSSVQVDQVQQNGQTSSTGTWEWTAYPDGSADDAGIEFQDDGSTKSLQMKINGDSNWVDGPLPNPGETRWTAGQLEQRT